MITHTEFDDVVVPITSYSDDLITVEMSHLKLNLAYRNTLKVGDTLHNAANGLALVLDSIADHRCPCNCLCQWEGTADIYMTLLNDGTTHAVFFSTYDTREDTVAGYRLVMSDIAPSCPPEETVNYQNYTVQIGLTALDSPRKILFVNHVKIEDRQKAGGTACAHLCVDFPTFWYNEATRTLSGRLPEITDSLQIIVGEGLYMAPESYGSGIGSSLYSVASLPFGDDYLSIDNIDSDGTISMHYNNESITLSAGDVYKRVRVEMNETEICTLQITITDSVVNHGYLYPWNISDRW